MQGRAIETAGAAASAYATVTAGADVRVNNNGIITGKRREHTTTHTEQIGGRTASVLAPDDTARVSDRAGTDHVASAAVDATADATDRNAWHQRCLDEREAGAVRAF